jgi:hypothetical protein
MLGIVNPLKINAEAGGREDLQYKVLRYCWEDLDQHPAGRMDLPSLTIIWTGLKYCRLCGFGDGGRKVRQNMLVGTRALLEGF